MRIVIDLQCAQTGSRQRDVGHHAKAIAIAIARGASGRHEVVLTLNGQFDETVEEIRQFFDGLIEPHHVRIWQPAFDVLNNATARRASEKIYEAFLASLQPDVVLIMSLFEGLHDAGVVSIGTFARLQTALLVHDQPSELGAPHASDDIRTRDWHRHKIESLRRADLLLATSRSAHDEVSQHFGLERERCIDLSAALAPAEGLEPDTAGTRALEALEHLHAQHRSTPLLPVAGSKRPRLACVSPLPGEHEDIGTLEAELLPFLAQHYDIELVSDDAPASERPLLKPFPVRPIAWFRNHFEGFDRVLYHFADSIRHRHMFELLAEIPGVALLRDFHLGGVFAQDREAWARALHASHGYTALAEVFRANVPKHVLLDYPCNFEVLAQAQGIIVPFSSWTELARRHFHPTISREWVLIPRPAMRAVEHQELRARWREQLGFGPEDFIVCSFGAVDPSRLGDRLIEAWRASSLAGTASCNLVLVGAVDVEPYGAKVSRAVQADSAEVAPNIRIAGRTTSQVFEAYLTIADLAVQLRADPMGDDAGAADALAHGLPTILNADGLQGGLATKAWCLPADFTEQELVAALQALWLQPDVRAALALRAQEVMAAAQRAAHYHEAIERFALAGATGRDGLVAAVAADHRLASSSTDAASTDDLAGISQAIADSLPTPAPQTQILIDVSELARHDAGTGIQRVVKGLLRELLASPPQGHRIEPVFAKAGQLGYFYARQFTLEFLGFPPVGLEDAPIDIRAGDLFVGLDLEPRLVVAQRLYYRWLRNRGVRVEFVVYDLLPVLLPARFMAGAAELHAQWLGVVAESDGALCISRAVAAELTTWMATQPREAGHPCRPFQIRSFHLGVDPLPARAAQGAWQHERLGQAMASRPSFLMVGTIEPRKGHLLVLDAFERIWSRGLEVNLVIVGRRGWMVADLVERVRRHSRLEQQLFWVESADDAAVMQIYAAASCLIAASEGEGFGLPLIEAAQHGLPLLARDIPVFREVAGDHGHYFAGNSDALEREVLAWLEARYPDERAFARNMPRLSWRESADAFVQALLDGQLG